MPKHAFRWNRDLSGRATCKNCGLKTQCVQWGPKGGTIQVYRVDGAWVKDAQPCKEKEE